MCDSQNINFTQSLESKVTGKWAFYEFFGGPVFGLPANSTLTSIVVAAPEKSISYFYCDQNNYPQFLPYVGNFGYVCITRFTEYRILVEYINYQIAEKWVASYRPTLNPPLSPWRRVVSVDSELQWIEPLYTNGASAYENDTFTLKYTKTSGNLVFLKGYLRLGTTDGNQLTLPFGYRSNKSYGLILLTASPTIKLVQININTSGEIGANVTGITREVVLLDTCFYTIQ